MPRAQEKTKVERFTARNGPEPWPCYFCGEPVAIGDYEYAIHHVDGDHSNTLHSNEKMSHFSCHSRHHANASGLRGGGGSPGRGEGHPRSKLTEDQVRDIRKKYEDGGWSHRDLAREFGVAYSAIKRIVDRTNWSHV